MKSRYARVAGYLCAAAAVIAVLLIWQNVSNGEAVFISRPSNVLSSLGSWFSDPSLRSEIGVTLVAAAIGFCLATAAAAALAAALAYSRLASAVLRPYVAVLNAVPKIALAPLFVLIFGTGLKSTVYFVAVGLFFIPFYSLYQALTIVDVSYIQHVKMLGGSSRAVVRDVYVPSVLSAVATTMRVTVAFALLHAVIAEMIASSGGIGDEVAIAQQSSNPPVLISAIILVAAISFLFDRLLVLAESRVVVWKGQA